MTLTPEQVQRFLLHDNDIVRDHTTQYVAEANDSTPASANDVRSQWPLPMWKWEEVQEMLSAS